MLKTMASYCFFGVVLSCSTLLNTVHSEELPRCTVKLDIEIIEEECSPNTTDVYQKQECKHTELCENGYILTYIALQKPYSYLIISDLISTCCGYCPSHREIIRNISKTSQIDDSLMDATDFVFPVLGRKDVSKLYGYRFLPMFRTPSLYLITLRNENVMAEILSKFHYEEIFESSSASVERICPYTFPS